MQIKKAYIIFIKLLFIIVFYIYCRLLLYIMFNHKNMDITKIAKIIFHIFIIDLYFIYVIFIKINNSEKQFIIIFL